jgi:subtilase family serine protease
MVFRLGKLGWYLLAFIDHQPFGFKRMAMKTMFAFSWHNRFLVYGWLIAGALTIPSLSAQSTAPRISGDISNSERTTLTGSLHPLAQAQFDAGRLPAATKLTGIGIFFSRSEAQEADLQALIAAQQDPASPLYHQWLTPDEFAARFGMADADLNKVKTWLAGQGFSIDSVARSRNMIRFSGTVNQVEHAFSTEMHYYNVEGKKHIAPATELSIPSALAPVVQGIRNLDDFRPRPMHVAPAHPDYTSSQSGSVHFAPGDIRVAYNIPSSYTGIGQSIAIMGQSAIAVSDIENFQNASGLAVKDPTQVLVPTTGSSVINPVGLGDEAESDIDLEWSGGIATGANIIFVYTGGSLNNNGVFDSIIYAVDEDIAPIISISYGACEPVEGGLSGVAAIESALLQAQSQGQTVIASSGDTGSTGCFISNPVAAGDPPLSTQEELAVSYPASSAYVTAAGGTETTAAEDVTTTPPGYWGPAINSSIDKITSALQWIPEVAWNDDSSANGLSSSGGGASVLFSKPAWQTGVAGIPADGKRDVPDIALYSSPDYPGYLFCSSDPSNGITGSCANGFRDANNTFLTIAGGTSFAAPVFAGMVALINQARDYTEGQGLINGELYTLASSGTTYASAFHDVTSGNNDCTAGATYCGSTAGYSAGTCYDEVTGLGSVNLANLILDWPQNSAASASLIATSTTVSASSSVPAVNATDTFTITVAAASGSATPSGNLTLSIDGGTTAYSNSGTTATVALVASGTAGIATATYQTSFSTVGMHQIIVEFPGSATFASSTGVVQVNVAGSSSGTGSFTFSSSPSTLAVTQGSSGTETITVTPSGGYKGTVLMTYNTSNNAVLTNLCVIASTVVGGYAEVAVTGTSAVQTTLTIDTKPADCGLAQPGSGNALHVLHPIHSAANKGASPVHRDPTPWTVTFAGLLLAGFLGRRSRKFHTMTGVIALLALGLAISACGGGSTSSTTGTTGIVPDPAKGSYTITIYGQDSATSTITGQTTFNLTIQ